MTKENHSCPFCINDEKREIILESDLAYAIFDKYPVGKGHVLIIPKRHCADYFNLSHEEQESCFELLNSVKQILVQNFHPDGFNVGINVGETAGQTIFHVHIHLIPRYKGDMPDPRGGVRAVIPEKRVYW